MWFWLIKMPTQKLLIVCGCWSWCCQNHLWQQSDSWQLVNSLKTALSQLGSRSDLFGQSFESASCSWMVVMHFLWQNSRDFSAFGNIGFLCRFSVRGASSHWRRWQHRSRGRSGCLILEETLEENVNLLNIVMNKSRYFVEIWENIKNHLSWIARHVGPNSATKKRAAFGRQCPDHPINIGALVGWVRLRTFQSSHVDWTCTIHGQCWIIWRRDNDQQQW